MGWLTALGRPAPRYVRCQAWVVRSWCAGPTYPPRPSGGRHTSPGRFPDLGSGWGAKLVSTCTYPAQLQAGATIHSRRGSSPNVCVMLTFHLSVRAPVCAWCGTPGVAATPRSSIPACLQGGRAKAGPLIQESQQGGSILILTISAARAFYKHRPCACAWRHVSACATTRVSQ